MRNHYRVTHYLKSVPDPTGAPPDQGREVAFAGRSNAGKSSALNAITDQRNLARTSKTPGRTRLINFFEVEPEVRLVDLPGYGYAKVSREMKNKWDQGLARYLETRNSLQGLFLLMDIRHPLKAYDEQMLAWCVSAGLPVHVLLTKADKLKKGPAKSQLLQVRRYLKELSPDCSAQTFSALKMTGLEEAWMVLDRWLGYPQNHNKIVEKS